jgi:hypothetical protein
MAMRPFHGEVDWQAPPSVSTLRLVPSLPWSVGFLPTCCSPRGALVITCLNLSRNWSFAL